MNSSLSSVVKSTELVGSSGEQKSFLMSTEVSEGNFDVKTGTEDREFLSRQWVPETGKCVCRVCTKSWWHENTLGCFLAEFWVMEENAFRSTEALVCRFPFLMVLPGKALHDVLL